MSYESSVMKLLTVVIYQPELGTPYLGWFYDKDSGTPVGVLQNDGTRQLKGPDGKTHQEDRLVYFLHHGIYQPHIYHIDGNDLNNDIKNLRRPTTQEVEKIKERQAQWRLGKRSAFQGVSWNKEQWVWQAVYSGSWLGYFGRPQAAAGAYDWVAYKDLGAYAQLNFPAQYPPYQQPKQPRFRSSQLCPLFEPSPAS